MEQQQGRPAEEVPANQQANPALPVVPDFVPYNPYAASNVNAAPPSNDNAAANYNAGQYSGPNLGRIPTSNTPLPPPPANQGNGFAPPPPTSNNFGNGFAPPAAGAYSYATPSRPTVSYGAAASDFRPLNVSETLDRSFALYRRNFTLFLTIFSLAYVPFMVLQIIFQVWWLRSANQDINNFSVRSNNFSTANTTALLNSLGHFYGTLAVYVLLLAIINVLQQLAAAALIYAANERYHGREVTFGTAYSYVWGRVGAMLGWLVLVYLLFFAAGISFAFLIGLVAVPILAPFFFVSLPALIIERQGAWAALSRSRQLISSGFWGMSIGLWLLTLILDWLLKQGIGTILVLLLSGIPGLNNTALVAINVAFNNLLDFVIAPIAIIAFTIFFINLRIRLEAYDIEAVVAMEVAK